MWGRKDKGCFQGPGLLGDARNCVKRFTQQWLYWAIPALWLLFLQCSPLGCGGKGVQSTFRGSLPWDAILCMLGMGAQLGAEPACCWALCCGSSGTTEPILFIIPGIVKEDPKLPEDKILPPPSPRPQNSIFDTDEEKSKVNLKAFLPATPLIFTAESTCRYMLCSFRAILMLLLNSRWRILWYFIRKHCLIKSELFLQK